MSKAISIHQPWAWLIAQGHKQLENRPKAFKSVRGWRLIHASKGMTLASYEAARAMMAERLPSLRFPELHELNHGGIVGRMKITGTTTASDSPWFIGPEAYTIGAAEPLPFHPCRGQQGWFDVPWMEATPSRCAFCEAAATAGQLGFAGMLDGCSCLV